MKSLIRSLCVDLPAASWLPILLVPTLQCGLATLFISFARPPAQTLTDLTGGIIQPTLLFNAASLVVIVAGVIGGMSRLRLADVGLHRARLSTGLWMTGALWLSMHAVLVMAVLVEGAPITLHPTWTETGLLASIGLLAGQLLGNALFEEIAFRGFLFPQLYLRMGGSRTDWDLARLTGALVASQLLFATVHVPIRIHQGFSGMALLLNLANVFAAGLLFALLYLWTQNLFVVVGIHALLNSPTPMLMSTIKPENVVLILSLTLLLIWPMLTRWPPRPASADRSPPPNA